MALGLKNLSVSQGDFEEKFMQEIMKEEEQYDKLPPMARKIINLQSIMETSLDSGTKSSPPPKKRRGN